jgi:hypothetical protein
MPAHERPATTLDILSPVRSGEKKMQQAITALLVLGPLPSSAAATAPTMQAIEEQLSMVQTPLTDEEACALIKLFGPDDCLGLAWTLLHLMETASGWPIESALVGLEGEWIDRLRERAAC